MESTRWLLNQHQTLTSYKIYLTETQVCEWISLIVIHDLFFVFKWQHAQTDLIKLSLKSVSIHCYTSEPAPISFGVPQGSVLGPVLFVLYRASLSTVIEKHSVFHSHADDSQLQKSAPPHQIPGLFLSMQKCIDDIRSWMTLNKLKLNDDKTEAMIVSSGRKSRSLLFFPSQTLYLYVVHLFSCRTLSRTLVLHLTMKTHVSNLVRSANFELRRISSIRHLLSTDATKTLVSAFVLSRLNYCNSLLFGCPQYLLNKLQKVQDNAARLVRSF